MNDVISNPNIITNSLMNDTTKLLNNTKQTIDIDLNNISNNISSITEDNVKNNLSSLNSGISFYSILKYLIIIVLLSLLGFNLFKNLGVLLDKIDIAIKYILNIFGYEIISKPLSNIQNNVIGVNKNTDEIKNADEIKTNDENVKKNMDENTRTLDNILNDTEEKLNIENNQANNENNIFKSGYCYIGEDKGYRTCIQVGETDKCMSGDIFPNKEICINPNLRM